MCADTFVYMQKTLWDAPGTSWLNRAVKNARIQWGKWHVTRKSLAKSTRVKDTIAWEATLNGRVSAHQKLLDVGSPKPWSGLYVYISGHWRWANNSGLALSWMLRLICFLLRLSNESIPIFKHSLYLSLSLYIYFSIQVILKYNTILFGYVITCPVCSKVDKIYGMLAIWGGHYGGYVLHPDIKQINQDCWSIIIIFMSYIMLLH